MTAGFLIPVAITAAISVTDFPISRQLVMLISSSSLVLLLAALHVHYMMVRSATSPLQKLRPLRAEFLQLVHDILHHDEFVKLKHFTHHTHHIYDHVSRVAYISYCIAKVFSLDYSSSARGGLLHDFFLYDWRQRKLMDPSKKLHGREHPRIALENASAHFLVNEREKDIILKHMFPKTIAPPRYLESAIVSLSDKVATVYEYIRHTLSRAGGIHAGSIVTDEKVAVQISTRTAAVENRR